MGPFDALLRLVLLPVGVCAACAFLARALLVRAPQAREALLASGPALAFALALATCGVRPDLPLAVSDSTWQWVVWLACAGALVGAALTLVRPPLLAVASLALVLGALGTWLVLRPLMPHLFAPGGAVARAALAGGVTALLWAGTERRLRASRGGSAVAAWLVAWVGAAVVLYQFGSAAVMSAAALAMASGVAATAACAAWGGRALLPAAIAPVLALPFVALLVAAHATLNHGARVLVPVESVVLLAASAGCSALPRWPVALALALLAAGAAVGLAYLRVGVWHAPIG